MKSETPQHFQPLESTTHPTTDKAPAAHVASLPPKTRMPICTKSMRQHPNSKEKNKRATENAADMKANRGLRKIYADKAFLMEAARLLFLATAIGAQGVVKATTGVELWSDPVLIALTSGVTVNALSAFLQVIHSLFPLSRSAGQQDRKKKPAAQKK